MVARYAYLTFLVVAVALALPASAQWTTNGSNVYKTDTAGNVGIGTTTPMTKLHVAAAPASIYFQHTGRLKTENQVAGILSFVDSAASEYAWFGDGSSSVNFVTLYAGTTHGLSMYAGGNVVFYAPVSGLVGIGTISPTEKLHVQGNILASGSITGSNVSATYQDVAEWVPSGGSLEPGTVVVIDTDAVNHVTPSTSAYDTSVAGVVSGQPGLILGEKGDQKSMVATTGRVKVKVDASFAAIGIGDLLVTSEKPGVAMKSEPMQVSGRKFHQPGTIVGKALEPLADGQGEILVLLSLQ